MKIQIIKNQISHKELREIAQNGFGDMVKAVVDIEQKIMAVGGELHADEEIVLMESEGSKRENVWGINIYPENLEGDWIKFDSMVNIKPSLGNRSRNIESEVIQQKIKEIVKSLVID